MTGRERVLVLLEKAQTEGTYSNLALDAELEKNSSERAFITALFYGVTERRMTLDHIIRTYSKTEFDKIENRTLLLLRMGLYQLLFMDIPELAAVNERVKLCTVRSKGFIN
ncbi:MAG: 16S rRNA (cytosine(967)-C(5))-methyltransferase RsmB, partial [Ruminiclostridium sp.]|nr:16S rRNA (cytosine(967)-C(5))-methyltransferase RsmB [Ruminiclostridium sp.]